MEGRVLYLLCLILGGKATPYAVNQPSDLHPQGAGHQGKRQLPLPTPLFNTFLQSPQLYCCSEKRLSEEAQGSGMH